MYILSLPGRNDFGCLPNNISYGDGAWHSEFRHYIGENTADSSCFGIWQLSHKEVSGVEVNYHQVFFAVVLEYVSLPIFSHGLIGISGCMIGDVGAAD